MLTTSIVIGAGQSVKFSDLGNFVRVLSAAEPVTVRTFRNGQVLTEAAGVSGGYAEQFEIDKPFNEVEIYSATAQTVQIAIRLGQVVYFDQAPTGTANIVAQVPAKATGSNTQKTVTNASASLLAANTAREYLLIQNKDASGNLYINFGAAATFANGVLIPPKGTLILDSNMLTAEIFAIGDIASNANIVVVEA
jgi:hypothetical protein